MFLPKAAALLAHLAWGLCLGVYLAFGGGNARAPERLGQRWHRRLLRIFNVHVRVEGKPMSGPHLTVANHVSWLDIPVLGAQEPTRFVAKSEVREWPIVGALAAAGGTFFIRRGKGGSGPLLMRMTPHLMHRGSVTVFPEGTTTDGCDVQTFHPRLFAAAVEAKRPVQPVTLSYGLSPAGENIAPFIGDDTLVGHIVRLLQAPRLDVVVRYGPPLKPGADREALAEEAESYVRGALTPPPPALLSPLHMPLTA